MFRYRNYQSKKDSYPYDTNSCMMMMNISPTWNKRDLNAIIYGDTWVSHQHNNKRVSNKKSMRNHDNKYIPQMIMHYIKKESWKQVRNKIPHQTSNKDLCHTMQSKRSTWTHCIYLTSWDHLKKVCQAAEDAYTINLMALNCMEITARTWMLTLALHFEQWLKNEMRKWKI